MTCDCAACQAWAPPAIDEPTPSEPVHFMRRDGARGAKLRRETDGSASVDIAYFAISPGRTV